MNAFTNGQIGMTLRPRSRAESSAARISFDPTPRPLPARLRLSGRSVELEPLHLRHAADLWQSAQGADASWRYLGYGPFPSAEAMAKHVAEFAAQHDPMAWAVRPVATGIVSGWLTLMPTV